MADLQNFEEQKDESFVSVITVLNTSNQSSLNRLKEIQQTLDANYSDYEIILVAQKRIQNHTKPKLDQILKDVPCVRYLQLSADVQSDVIWSAGTENAIGDFIVCFDLQSDPTELILKAVNLCKSGHDVVVGTAKESCSLAYRLVRPISGWLLKLVDYQLPKGATTFRCLSRRAVNAVMDLGRFYQQFFMQIQKTGYGYTVLPYTQIHQPKEKSLFGGIRSALKLMVFNTSLPLRVISCLGLVGSVVALLISLYSILLKVLKDDVVAGWTSTVFLISVFATIQFIILIFISEFLNRILVESSKSAEYSIVFEKDSSVMVNLDRINVLENSESDKPNLVQTGRDR